MFDKCQGESHKMFNFEEIINRLIQETKVKNKSELCELMGVSTQTMGNWKTRNKIPYEEIHTICLEKNIDINYIFNNKNNNNKEELINYEEEITKNISKLTKNELKYFYHLIISEIAKKDL